jgi:hypothetical protein
MTNALAYQAAVVITTVKRFVVQVPREFNNNESNELKKKKELEKKIFFY